MRLSLHTVRQCRVALVLFAAWLTAAAWPVGAATLPSPSGRIVLMVAGHIERHNHLDEAHFDEAMLASLPARTLYTHTVVTDGRRRFDGVLLRDLLAHVGARGSVIQASALNRYSVDIPWRDIDQFDVLLATHMDGERLQPEDKGPIWVVYPRDDYRLLQDIRYDYRWVWQLERLVVK